MQWDALVNQCGTIEFMITAHSQFLVMIFDYVVVQLRKNMKELVAEGWHFIFDRILTNVNTQYTQRMYNIIKYSSHLVSLCQRKAKNAPTPLIAKETIR